MKILQFILDSIVSILFTSADPNLFGSRKRRKEKAKLAKEFKGFATEAQRDIDVLKATNPFESAAAKSAMATSARKAKQMQQRYANILGGQATPESLIAAQGATQEAIGATAGDIATGAEALRAGEVAQLRSEKAGYRGQYGQMKKSSIEERGSGWRDFFQTVLPAVGGMMEGGGSAMSSMGGMGGMGGAASGGAASGAAAGSSGAALAALSDRRAKENIHFIGELQGRRVYKYNFIGYPATVIGVISQEIEKTDPDMVIDVDGFKKTFYDKVFKTVK